MTHIRDVLVALILCLALWLLATALLTGCCTTGWKARCCDPPPPPVLVKVRTLCTLPPAIELPEVLPDPGCPKQWMCLDLDNAKRLALREARMKTWIKEARAACGAVDAASQPATQPTSRPIEVTPGGAQ